MSTLSMSFREYLETKDAVYGIFAKTADPFFIEAMGRAGWDFVILDNEHGPNSPRELYPLLMASTMNGMYPIVRVGKLDALEIQRVLDLGVAGVQIPQIQCREDAEKAGKYARFYPKGERGVCRFVRAADFSLKDKEHYFQEQNEVATIIHIEGMEGVQNFDEIVEVDGIDVIFIGPYDLSQSLGVTGQVDHPKVMEEIKKLIQRCKEKKKHIGIFTESVEGAQAYKDLGVKYISYSVDVGIFAGACRQIIGELHKL
jgi:4-hydroxy-2-oxoheptanedioate aldolase